MKSPKPNQTLCQVFMAELNTTNMNKFTAKIQAATLADAKEWSASSEPMMWAIEFLGGFSVLQVSEVIDELEAKLESLLAAQEVKP